MGSGCHDAFGANVIAHTHQVWYLGRGRCIGIRVGCFAGRATAVYAVPVPGHAHHAPAALAAAAKEVGLPGLVADTVPAAIAEIGKGADRARPPVVLVAGSLYLAGSVLQANGQDAG